eukprot:scaffold1903_cov396-Prasinococcus_capsulatus_cf.AAC.27
MSGRLVAAITTTIFFGSMGLPSLFMLVSKPSSSVSSWFTVASRSSFPLPPPPLPRCLPTASNSSIKTIEGACALACWNRSRTRAAPTPTNISTNSEALDAKKVTPASPATARASSVLPVPGGPQSRTPLSATAACRTQLATNSTAEHTNYPR